MAQRDRTYDKYIGGLVDSRDVRRCPGALPQMDAAAQMPLGGSADLDAPLGDAPARDPWADWRRRLEDLLHDPNSSDRSQGFLESLDEQLTAKGFLSEAQQAAVERIEADRDGGRRGRF